LVRSSGTSSGKAGAAEDPDRHATNRKHNWASGRYRVRGLRSARMVVDRINTRDTAVQARMPVNHDAGFRTARAGGWIRAAGERRVGCRAGGTRVG